MKKILMIIVMLVVCLAPMATEVYAYSINDGAYTYKKSSDPEYVGDNFCAQPETKRTFRIFGYVLSVLELAVPLIIIVVGSFNMFKAVSGGNMEAITKQGKDLLIRVFIGLLIFFIPKVVFYVITIVDDGANTSECAKCLLKPNDCTIPKN